MKSTMTVAVQAAMAALMLAGCANTAPGPMAEIKPVLRVSNEAGPAAWYQLGRYYQGQGRHDRAELAFRRALLLDDSNADAYNALGATLAARGRLAEAVEAFQSGLRVAPKAAYIHANLGRAYLLQGQRDEALAELQAALTLDPANRGARDSLAQAEGSGGMASKGAPLPASLPATAAAPAAGTAQPRSAEVTGGEGIAVVSPVPVSDSRAEVQVVQIGSSVPDRGRAPVEVVSPLAVMPSIVPTEPSRVDIGRIMPMEVAKVAELPPASALPSQPSTAPSSPSGSPVAVTSPPASAAVSVPRSGGSTGFRLEVANGNGVTGLARRVGRSLVEVGYPASRLTNQKPFQQAVTQIQYRDGYEQQARALGRRFAQPPEVVARNGLNPRADVRIVLGHDLPREFALNLGSASPLKLAAAPKD